MNGAYVKARTGFIGKMVLVKGLCYTLFYALLLITQGLCMISDHHHNALSYVRQKLIAAEVRFHAAFF